MKPNWLIEAEKDLGLREIPGVKHEPKIIKMLVSLNAWWRDDETPWCGVVCGYWFNQVGIEHPKAYYRAKAWLDWGVPLSSPVYGCVVIFVRDGGGHVGIVVGRDKLGRLMVLGGNQGNKVSIAPFDMNRVAGYRYPLNQPINSNQYRLPLIETDQSSSRNEA